MNVTFDPVQHRYYAPDGHEMPSTTRLIGEWWPVDRYFFKAAGTQRGTDVHEITAQIDSGIMPMDISLYPGIESYLLAWREFLNLSGARIIAVEQSMGHSILDYAGTLDRIVEYRGGTWIWDLKTGAKDTWHDSQGGAYALLAEDHGIEIVGTACIYLSSSGTATKVDHDTESAKKAWIARLHSERYRKAKKGEPWC